MTSKALSTLIIVLVIFFALPMFIGIAGGLFGIVMGIFGAIVGAVAGVIGAFVGAIGSIFSWSFGGLFGCGLTSVLIVAAIVLLVTKRR
jgi:hypothetical protein